MRSNLKRYAGYVKLMFRRIPDCSLKGFTLIELVVVLAVMGTVLFITLPMFRPLVSDDNSQKKLHVLMNNIRELKKRAVSDNSDYILHLDTAKSLMWVTSENIMAHTITGIAGKAALTDKAKLSEFMKRTEREYLENARKNAKPLPENISVMDVEIYGLPRRQRLDEYQIRFSREGYSDMAIIHLVNREAMERLSIIVPPFLSGAEIRNRHVSFDQCR